jgi:uncharacterized protein
MKCLREFTPQKGEIMKFSRFNLTGRTQDEFLVYNSLSGALIAFEKPYLAAASEAFQKSAVEKLPENFLASMKEEGVLVEDEFDELDVIRILTATRIGWTESWHFSIMLNQICNLCCPYCFQPRKNLVMSDLVGDLVVKAMQRVAAQTKKISIDWYGGEPTLSFDLLKRLNDRIAAICKKVGIEYMVSMTTNGYVLNDEILSYLASSQTSHLQITLDAPKENHDFKRIPASGKPTFDVILANIQKTVSAGIHVLVRVNVAKQNLDRSFEIYDALEKAGLKNKVEVMIRPIISSEANPCAGDCVNPVLFGKKMISHYLKAAKEGWIVLPFVDTLQSMGYCIADYPTHAIIDPEGNVYKCGEAFSESENIGKIDDNGDISWNKEGFDAFVLRDPLQLSECRVCPILPICMGGCHMLRFWKHRMSCNEFKHDLPSFVETLYFNQMNMEGGEKHENSS